MTPASFPCRGKGPRACHRLDFRVAGPVVVATSQEAMRGMASASKRTMTAHIGLTWSLFPGGGVSGDVGNRLRQEHGQRHDQNYLMPH